MTFTIVKPGLMTTVQDLGRPQAAASGVTPGGAMDRFAHISANLLVGNDRSAATLECTITGPSLVADVACVVAVAGANLEPMIDGRPMPMWTGVALAAGQTLEFGVRRSGARAYIAVAGGFAADRWLGSMSTNLLVGRGGMHWRSVRRGDAIATGPAAWAEGGLTLPPALRPDYAERSLRVLPGPQAGRMPAGSWRKLVSAPYVLSASSNRMGYRLEGPTLEAPGQELLSFHLVPGAIQLPSGGRPILLMADHQTAGGYPVIAVVVSASMTVAAQLAPGDELRFEEIGVEEALAMRAAQRAALDSLMTLSM